MTEKIFLHQQSGDVAVTIAAGEVPVMQCTLGGAELLLVVNFLRCGCPLVQLLFWKEWKDDEQLNLIRRRLTPLERPGETFHFYPQGKVLEVTRTTPE